MVSNSRPSVYVHTLGCPKNEWDSDVLLSRLTEAGHPYAPEDAAEVIIVNTCAFIEPAKQESVDEILRLAEWKEAGACRLLIVVGCLAERYRDALPALLPEVDAFLPLASTEELIRLLGARRVDANDTGTPHGLRRNWATAGTGMAYLKISEGCDRACTFCAIPGIRGPLVSRAMDDILEEAEWLKGLGARELVLVAQDTTAYGADLYGRQRLPELLQELSRPVGDYRVRLLYLQPEGIDDALLGALDSPRVCRYLDIPLQHVASDVLRAMGRPGSAGHFRRLLDEVRSVLPGVALRTTLLLGFPGEGRRQFAEVLEFVREQRFDWLGVFGYSREEATRAWELGRGPAATTVGARSARIMETQIEIMADHAMQQVGRTIRVLVERESDTLPGHMEARGERHAPDVDGLVYVRGDLEPGRFYEVEIIGTEGIDEVGRVAR